MPDAPLLRGRAGDGFCALPNSPRLSSPHITTDPPPLCLLQEMVSDMFNNLICSSLLHKLLLTAPHPPPSPLPPAAGDGV